MERVHSLQVQVHDEQVVLLLRLGAPVLLPLDRGWLALLGGWGHDLPRDLGVFEAHVARFRLLVAHDRLAKLLQCRDRVGLLVLQRDDFVAPLELVRVRLLRLVDRVVLVEQDGILEVLPKHRHDRLESLVAKVAHLAGR